MAALCLLFTLGISYLLVARSGVILSGYQDASCRKPFHFGRLGPAPPGCSGTRDLGAGPAPIAFNSLGYRDQEHALIPAPGVYRIAILGGSVHMSPGLPEEGNLARILERELAANGLEEVEVLNFSVEGYTTVSHFAHFRKYLQFRPNLILLATVDGHKPFRDLWTGDFTKALTQESVELMNIHEALGPKLDLIYRFSPRAALFAAHLLQAASQIRNARALQRQDAGSPAQAKALLASTLTLMASMRALARNAGAGFQFVWPGEPLTNQVALLISDSPALAYLSAPWMPNIHIEAAVGLAAFREAGELPLDISTAYPRQDDRPSYLGPTYYLSQVGMEKFGKALAAALTPGIQQTRQTSRKLELSRKRR